MPNKFISSPNKPVKGLSSVLPPELQEQLISEETFDKGMFSDIDPSRIPQGGFKLAKNSVVRDFKTSRRPGTSLFTPGAPDANRVLKLSDFVRGNKITNIVRHTKDTIKYLTTSAWVPCTGSALFGTDFDRHSSVIIDDRYFFTNNGKNVIQELSIDTNTYFDNGNAGKYKKITGFFNRLVAANLQGSSPNPISLAWSGDLNFGEWDPLVDPSAGALNLVDANVDISDFITDIFGFDAVLVILREKSIWMATKQPSASDPFNLFAKIPGQGCTCTYGAARFPMGIIFPDLRTKSVYVFTIDGQIEDIGTPIRRALFAAIGDPEAVFSSYNPVEAEYSICVPNEFTAITQEWRYNFRAKAWTYNELPAISSISDVDNIAGSRTINELQGSINGLLGTINDLSIPISQLPRRVYGRYDGNIAIETNGQVDDTIFEMGYGFNYGNDYGGTLELLPSNFTSTWESKVYLNPGHNLYISTVALEIVCRTAGTILLEFSRDGGATYNTARVFTIASTDLNKVVTLFHRRQFLAKRFQWRLTTLDIDLDILTGLIKVYPNSALDK